MLGWRTVCAVEVDEYARNVLIARQNDGCLEPFPVWDDVRTFDGKPWRGIVDVVSGGFPCQDISVAGKGAGLKGARSGLWGEMARIIGEVRPEYAFIENSPMLIIRGLDRVLCDLAAMGYSAKWGVIGAADAGAPHKRDRVWIVAHSDLSERGPQREACNGLERPDSVPQREESAGWVGGCREDLADSNSIGRDGRTGTERTQDGRRQSENGREGLAYPNGMRELQPQGSERDEQRRSGNGSEEVADADRTGREEQRRAVADGTKHEAIERGGWWSVEPAVGRMAHGVAFRVDRLRCLGNGQVPAVAALAWEILST